MAENEGLDIEKIQLLRDRGLTCSKLKSLENRERREKQNDFKQAQVYRSLGFLQASEKKEVIGKAQEELGNTLSRLKKQVCGLK